eukprot:CAMPEP_0184511266 /NCGR_PEP_ID=MMETSP0198_2-20121128/2259_1 /TAXON_ID=1112570 /ORGANISM="Thraustochytrium sp., Strain LLF1b" /LENGTH=111 /DNA_ID=CAMNT_0026901219 /DNA_START=1299 /DNA_END=1631 /DNA_ORIENTATION=-
MALKIQGMGQKKGQSLTVTCQQVAAEAMAAEALAVEATAAGASAGHQPRLELRVPFILKVIRACIPHHNQVTRLLGAPHLRQFAVQIAAESLRNTFLLLQGCKIPVAFTPK